LEGQRKQLHQPESHLGHDLSSGERKERKKRFIPESFTPQKRALLDHWIRVKREGPNDVLEWGPHKRFKDLPDLVAAGLDAITCKDLDLLREQNHSVLSIREEIAVGRKYTVRLMKTFEALHKLAKRRTREEGRFHTIPLSLLACFHDHINETLVVRGNFLKNTLTPDFFATLDLSAKGELEKHKHLLAPMPTYSIMHIMPLERAKRWVDFLSPKEDDETGHEQRLDIKWLGTFGQFVASELSEEQNLVWLKEMMGGEEDNSLCAPEDSLKSIRKALLDKMG